LIFGFIGRVDIKVVLWGGKASWWHLRNAHRNQN
jgi:hypothetical protein